MKKLGFHPFTNETESLEIGGLKVENRLDRISMYRSIDITRDREGLANAEALKAILDGIVKTLRAEQLPDKITITPAEEVENPFNKKITP